MSDLEYILGSEWVANAKQAYVSGNISLEELEHALDDRLSGPPFEPLPHEDPCNPLRMPISEGVRVRV